MAERIKRIGKHLRPKPQENDAVAPDPEKVAGELLSAANDGAKSLRSLYVSFMLFALYAIISVAGVDDEQLLRETPLKLPVIGADIPLLGYFALLPLLFVLFHFELLLQFAMLSNKLHMFRVATDAISDTERKANFRHRVENFMLSHLLAGEHQTPMRRLLMLVLYSSLVLLPAATLLLTQYMFLPYHSLSMTWWHRICIAVDLILVSYFWVSLFHAGDLTLREWWQALWTACGAPFRTAKQFFLNVFHWFQRFSTARDHWDTFGSQSHAVGLGMVLLLSLPLSFLLLTIPEEPYFDAAISWETEVYSNVSNIDAEDGNPAYSMLSIKDKWLHRNLDLHDKVLIGEGSSPEIREQIRKGKNPVGFEPLDLRNRDLRHVILVRTHLSAANLAGADMTDADLSGSGLNGADLRRAKLNGANLCNAKLNGAICSEAQLNGVKLWDAQLFGVDFTDAQLNGADLWGAQLSGAKLRNAQLYGSILSEAQLNGVDLTNAQLGGADLGDALLNGAILFIAQNQIFTTIAQKSWLDKYIQNNPGPMPKRTQQAVVRLDAIAREERKTTWPTETTSCIANAIKGCLFSGEIDGDFAKGLAYELGELTCSADYGEQGNQNAVTLWINSAASSREASNFFLEAIKQGECPNLWRQKIPLLNRLRFNNNKINADGLRDEWVNLIQTTPSPEPQPYLGTH